MIAPDRITPKDTDRRSKRRVLRGVGLLLLGTALIGSLPRPMWVDVAVPESSEAGANGRWAFRSARRLVELSGKGVTADDTELNGPCLADDDQTLYFTRSRSGSRSDIVRSRLSGSRWSRPEPVREINSVDEDWRVTISADNRSLIVASNRTGTRGGLDLWESTGANGRWSRPKNLGTAINTAAYESHPALSPDGLMLLFVREVHGRQELFFSRRERSAAAWSAPQPVTNANSLTGDIVSQTFAADGRSIWFVVQGPRFSSQEDRVFQALVADGQIGIAAPVRDAIAAAGDLMSPAFSADGRSLIFASTRDSGVQLYQSQAEWVVTRLSISTAHLDRFGRAKWGVPIGLAILLIVVARMTRRTNSAARSPAQTATSKRTSQIATVAAPVRRSTPPVNPLANWPTAPATTSISTPKLTLGEPAGVSPRTIAAGRMDSPVQGLTPSGSPEVRGGDTARSTRRVRLRRIAGCLSVAAVALFGIWSRDRWLPSASIFLPSDWSQFHQFRDITAQTPETLPVVARVATARITAPDSSAVATESATLRQTARWPKELVVIRNPAPLFVAPLVTPELSGIAKLTEFARPATLGPMARRDRGFVENIPIEAITLTIAESAPEKPLAVPVINTVRRLNDPPTTVSLNPAGWPTGMQSPAKLYLAPNELVPIQPPTVWLSLVSPNRGSSAIATPADADPGLPLAQPLNDLSVVVALNPLPRSPVGNSASVPSTPATWASNPAVEVRATSTDTSVIQNLASTVSNGLTPQSLAVARHTPREATAIAANPDGPNPPGQAEPTILLTSAQTMTELFAVAPISPLNRVDLPVSAAKPAELPPTSLAAWFRQLLMPPATNEARAETITTSSQLPIALPLRVKETPAAAIPESVVPIFE